MGRKRGKSRGRKSKSRGSGLFKPPRHKDIAEIVSFKNPREAREAASRLVNALERGRLGKKKVGKKRALTIARALTYAANRAEASAKRRNLSPKERRELKEIAEIYRDAADEAWEIYHEKYD